MKRVLLALIRFYRKYISPAFPGKCRFIPTCSEYGLEAIENTAPFGAAGSRSSACCGATPSTTAIL